MNQFAAPVVSNQEVMPGVHLLWLYAAAIASEAKPGQFVMVACGGETTLPRPLSIHQTDVGKIALLIRAIGKGTDWLSKREAGDKLNIFGPLGNGFSITKGTKNLLLVAGGIGIAPLYFLAEQASKKGLWVTVLYGTADKNRLTIPSEIKQIAATDDGSVGHKGMLTDLLPDFAGRADQIFACGPLPMYRAMARMPSLKNKSVQVSLEVVMGCGRGVCYGCTIKTKSGLKKVCEDGPVFNIDDILWDEMR